MFAFVILHYMVTDVTRECVESIQFSMKGKAYKIVIVDNGSSNGSGDELACKYKNNENIEVIINAQNVGYAKGNNVGYEYARNEYNPDFIVVLNNDVIINDTNFEKKIVDIFNQEQFEILGPDIVSLSTGLHQNPMRATAYSRAELIEIRNDRNRKLMVYPVYYFFYYFINNIKKIVKKMIAYKRIAKKEELTNFHIKSVNSILHGACLIFSYKFISMEKKAFNERTFLYMEENILHYECMKKGYKMVYNPQIVIEHKEDVATDYFFRSNYKKKKNKYINLINSISVLLDIME